MDGNQTAGTTIGAASSVMGMILGVISPESMLEAAVLAFIGASIGFLTTHLWKKVFKIK
jgi:hypothetical protein